MFLCQRETPKEKLIMLEKGLALFKKKQTNKKNRTKKKEKEKGSPSPVDLNKFWTVKFVTQPPPIAMKGSVSLTFGRVFKLYAILS